MGLIGPPCCTRHAGIALPENAQILIQLKTSIRVITVTKRAIPMASSNIAIPQAFSAEASSARVSADPISSHATDAAPSG
jgi:hypothetical protein